jgi:hypothetical protein
MDTNTDRIVYVWRREVDGRHYFETGPIEQLASAYETGEPAPAHVMVATEPGCPTVTVTIERRTSGDQIVTDFVCGWGDGEAEAISYTVLSVALGEGQAVEYSTDALASLCQAKKRAGNWIVETTPLVLCFAAYHIGNCGWQLDGDGCGIESGPMCVRHAISTIAALLAESADRHFQMVGLWEHTATALTHYLQPQWLGSSDFTDVTRALTAWNNTTTTTEVVRDALYDAADWYQTMPDLSQRPD